MHTGFCLRLVAVVLIAGLTAQWCSAQANPPTDLKTLSAKYDQALTGIQTAIDKALEDWPPAYVTELKKAEQKLQANGDLEGMLAVRKERERFEKEKKIPDGAMSEVPVLKDLQLKWRKTPEAIELDRSKRIVALAKSYMAALDEAKKHLTKQGKVDPAIEMKNEIERVKTSAPVTAAEFALANAAASVPVVGKDAKPAEVKPEPDVAEKPSAVPADLRKSLVLYYSFDKDEDDKVTDLSGNKNDAIVRGAKYSSKGKKGGAYRFNGGNDIIYSTQSVTVSRDSDDTICAWFKKSGGGTMGIVRIGTESGDRVDRNVLVLTLDVSPLVARADVSQVDGRLTPGFPLQDEVWYHAALVYSKLKVSLYANGKFVGSVKNDIPGSIPGNAGVTRIGGHYVYASECPFIGLIDEVMIFNRALTEEEIKKIYDSQK